MSSMAGAYSVTGGAWQHGPGLIYDRLATELVRRCPAVPGGVVLDVGAGTGAASRAALFAGATAVVAVDVAVGMVAFDAANRPPAVVGDSLALPFADDAFDAAVAAFSLNHVADAAAGLQEMMRVVRRGGSLVASAYAADDTHPVKAAVEDALRGRGWVPDGWYLDLRSGGAVEQLATVDGFAAVARAAGLDAECEVLRVSFPELGPKEMVAWRMGMAQHAEFLATRAAAERADIAADAIARLGADPPPLVRAVTVLRAASP